jgi:transcriptional regulator with XRE-family HTH domain
VTIHSPQSAPFSLRVNDVLRRTRKVRGMSTQRLADALAIRGYPIRRATIANIEAGRMSTLSLDYAVLAAKVLGVDLAAVLAGEVLCKQCGDKPDAGFICGACGVGS